MKLLGYEVTPVSMEVAQGHVAYTLAGPRATYRLVRYQSKPHYLFAINSLGNICGLKGNYTFTDADGALHCA